MPGKRAHLIRILAHLGAISGLALVVLAQTPSNPPQQPPQSPKSTPLQVNTRLVTVDVVATDSHGKPIRDLKPEDFEVRDGGRQKIEKFAFIERPSGPGATAASASRASSGSYTNQIGVDTLVSPPTVILVDSLNTATTDLVQTRRHMLDLLKTLPGNTPVAVLLLGTTLHMVQNFTTDPSLLRAAIDRASRSPSVIQTMPQDDPNSLSFQATQANNNQENDEIQMLEDFEKETYAQQMDIRITTTLDSLKAVAGYLRAYQGRKNLIWVSESFPLALWPDTDFGNGTGSAYPNAFRGTRDYADRIQQAANALTDARVAVYPVDARGLETDAIAAAQSGSGILGSASRNPSAQIRRMRMTRMMAQSSMDQLAETTGGRTCKNTNDLSGCVESAVSDGSSYYEIAYAPADVRWDGRFRTISLKVNRSGAKLSYRRGYYALDALGAASKESPEQRLREACHDFLPSTAIPIAAKAILPKEPGEASYWIAIPPGAFTVSPSGESYKIGAMLASCVFPPQGDSFAMTTHDLSETLSASAYADFAAHGISGPANFPHQDAGRVRIAVVDETSGLVGALDIPVRPRDFADLAPASQPANPANAPAPTIPASAPQLEPAHDAQSPQLATTIGFNLPTGESAKLDWTGDKLVYVGDIPVEKTAPAFFQQVYESKGFHCSAGGLVPDDPNAPKPNLRLVFTNAAGQSAVIDLRGGQPQYSGTIGIDSSVRPFFDRLWYPVNCRATP